VPVLVLDVTEEEAKVLLATLDPLAELAEANTERLATLLQDVETTNEAVQEVLNDLGEWWGVGQDDEKPQKDKPKVIRGATLDDLRPSEDEQAELEGKILVIQFSGGKDSSAAAVWAKRYFPTADLRLAFCDMGADFVGMEMFLREFSAWIGAPLVICRSEENMIDHILDKGEWPHFAHPYCHEVLHAGMDPYFLSFEPGTMVVLRGGRLQEKAARSTPRTDRWLLVERIKDVRFFQPLYFADKGSGERILAESGAPLWPGYSRGLCRTACRICPGQRPIAYTAIRREFPDVWVELTKMEEQLGVGTWNIGVSFAELADKGEEMEKKKAGDEGSPAE